AAALGVRMTIEDTWGGDLVTAAVSHLAASTPPEALLHAPFMNDWVSDHGAGPAPRSRDGRGAAPDAAGLGIEVDAAALGAPLARVGGEPASARGYCSPASTRGGGERAAPR